MLQLYYLTSLSHYSESRFYKDWQIRKTRHWKGLSLVKGHTSIGKQGMEAIHKPRLHGHLYSVGSSYPETASSPSAAGRLAGGSPESSGPAPEI